MWVLSAALFLILAYLLGSIPSGLIAGYFRGIDIRQHGSGNIGATNVQRTLGWGFGLLVLLGDAGKGAAAVLLVRYLFAAPAPVSAAVQVLAALAVVAGHNWSLAVRLSTGRWGGGRGVATGVGTLFIFFPAVGIASFVGAAAAIGATRYVSVGSIVGTLIGGVGTIALTLIYDQPRVFIAYAVLIPALLIFQHRDNLTRVWRGTERKLGEPAKLAPREAARASQPQPPGGRVG